MAYLEHQLSSADIKVTTVPKTFSIEHHTGNLLLLKNLDNLTPIQYALGDGPVALEMYSSWPPQDSETGRSPVVPPDGRIPEDRTGHTHITVATPSGQAWLLVIDAEAHRR